MPPTTETTPEYARVAIGAMTSVTELREYAVLLLEHLSRSNDALRFICTTNDSGYWIKVYRDAGGGYEGLQAVAASALGIDLA